MARAKTKSAKIRKLLDEGKSVPEVVKAVKASPSMVYAIRSQMRKEGTGIAVLSSTTTRTNSGIPTLTQDRTWRNNQGRPTVENAPKPKLTFWRRVVEWIKGY